MFIRCKKISGKQYAYLVSNDWTSKGPRQRVLQYLGNVHTPQKSAELGVIHQQTFQENIHQLLTRELQQHGFVRQDEVWKDGDVLVSIAERTCNKKNNPVAIQINEGFLCNHTLQQLSTFRQDREPHITGKQLATLLVEAGIMIPEDAFIQLVEQLHPNEQLSSLEQQNPLPLHSPQELHEEKIDPTSSLFLVEVQTQPDILQQK